MAWEKRKSGRLYYTRSRRINGRVHREYYGCGDRGHIAAAEDEARRAREVACKKSEQEERQRLDRLEESLQSLDESCSLLLRTVLRRAGFYQHRGEWRRRRQLDE
jgi:hypothetical protein